MRRAAVHNRQEMQYFRFLVKWRGFYYLTAAGIGDLRNGNDANCTYEGENNVLIQQTGNWLLQLWKNRFTNPEGLKSPYGTTDFLANASQTLASKCKFRTVRTKLTGVLSLSRGLIFDYFFSNLGRRSRRCEQHFSCLWLARVLSITKHRGKSKKLEKRRLRWFHYQRRISNLLWQISQFGFYWGKKNSEIMSFLK